MQNSEVIKIGIIAGEHSGDLIGSKLIEQIKKDYKIKIYGIGGRDPHFYLDKARSNPLSTVNLQPHGGAHRGATECKPPSIRN